MPTDIEQLGYESKSAEYFQQSRPEMLQFVPTHCRQVLDVGCGQGAFGESLKRTRGTEVWGVEPVHAAAEVARRRLDKVVEGVFGPELSLCADKFDCIVLNDVLEHMLCPENALAYARKLLRPGGVVVASIPNVRNFPTIWQLIMRDRWEYKDWGVLDRTHLRFFTESSIVTMFERHDFVVELVCGINAYLGNPNASRRLWAAFKAVNIMAGRRFNNMKFQQFAILARVAPAKEL